MKKRKTYEVSVINKTYSKTYSDQTKFYTSDTALELNFQLKEVEYDFDSAEIILLNVDDRSLVTRPVVKNADGFTYELEDDIVERYGEWKGQLKFTEGGEIYVSSPVVFRIENDLSNDRPPQLTEVNNWKNLRAIADGLIADIRSELESVAVKVSEIEGAESERQQSEASRVNAEEQRKIDHANRSAELAGKADKVVLKNLVENGDFSDGTSWWSANYCTLTHENSIVKLSSNGTSRTMRILQPVTFNSSDIYYLTFKHKTPTTPMTISIRYVSDSKKEVDSFGTYSTIFKLTGVYTSLQIEFTADLTTSDNVELESIALFNLTEVFGAGNEPSKEEMDRLIEVTGYIDGEYALNNKEMFGYLMKGIGEKADKKQEDWITLPLYNGAQHGDSPLKVMKDEMGVVHFKGSLTNLVSGSKVFGVPVEYRPDIGATEGYIRVPLALGSGMGTSAAQINYVGDCYTINASNTTVSFFDGVSYLAKRS